MLGFGPGAADARRGAGPVALTRSAKASITPGGSHGAIAACPKGTYASGGGFGVSTGFDPASNTGSRTVNLTSMPLGARRWSSVGSALAEPAAGGTFTNFVRCESRSLGKVTKRLFGSVTVAPAEGRNLILNCPPKTQAVSGGFQAEASTDFVDPRAFRILMLGSRRTAPGQWTVSGFNSELSTAPALLSGFVDCGPVAQRRLTEAMSSTPLMEDARATARATCGRTKHSVSGGFLIAPSEFPGRVSVAGIDQLHPVGSRSWQAGLYEFPAFPLASGASLTAIAYCKANR